MNSTLLSTFVSSSQCEPNIKKTHTNCTDCHTENNLRLVGGGPAPAVWKWPHTYNLSSVKLEELSQFKYSSLQLKAQRGKASRRKSKAVSLACCRSSRKENKKGKETKSDWHLLAFCICPAEEEKEEEEKEKKGVDGPFGVAQLAASKQECKDNRRDEIT